MKYSYSIHSSGPPLDTVKAHLLRDYDESVAAYEVHGPSYIIPSPILSDYPSAVAAYEVDAESLLSSYPSTVAAYSS